MELKVFAKNTVKGLETDLGQVTILLFTNSYLILLEMDKCLLGK